MVARIEFPNTVGARTFSDLHDGREDDLVRIAKDDIEIPAVPPLRMSRPVVPPNRLSSPVPPDSCRCLIPIKAIITSIAIQGVTSTTERTEPVIAR